MLREINTLLTEWVDWRISRRYGYRYRTTLGDLLVHRGAIGGRRPGAGGARTRGAAPPRREMLDLDFAVRTLPPSLHRIILLYYARCCSLGGLEAQACSAETLARHRCVDVPAIANILGIERRTVYARLHSAHVQLLILLRERRSDRRPLKPRMRGAVPRPARKAAPNAGREKALDSAAAIAQNPVHSARVA